jgi:hypothetical protein
VPCNITCILTMWFKGGSQSNRGYFDNYIAFINSYYIKSLFKPYLATLYKFGQIFAAQLVISV